MVKSKQLILAKHAEGGDISDDLFKVETKEISASPGTLLIRTLALSCDPTQRMWVTNVPQYMPPVQVGEVMRAAYAGEVVEAPEGSGFAKGDLVAGMANAWSEYQIAPASGPMAPHKAPKGLTAAQIAGSVVCPPTAYVGLVFHGKVRPGDTVFVTGAAGATGSLVVQIAKLMQCRVIGVAGGKKKCDYVVKELGADHCIDYKDDKVPVIAALMEVAGGEVDVVFDNVGGEQLDAGLAALAMHARVVICGAIASYTSLGDASAEGFGPKNYMNLLMKRATMTGFIFMDDAAQVAEANGRITKWMMEGKLNFKIDAREGGIEDAPKNVRRLFSGDNYGKCVHIVTGVEQVSASAVERV